MVTVSAYIHDLSIGSIVETIESGIKMNKFAFQECVKVSALKCQYAFFPNKSNHLRVPVKFIIPLLNIAAIICKLYIIDCVPNFHPVVATCRDREYLAECPVHGSGDNKAAEEVDVVKVFRAVGDITADCACEAHNIDQNARTVA